MKIAIVGTGISGLGAAYWLSQKHDIVVYEKNNYIGGHSRTIDVPTPRENGSAGSMPVDTGFIVFNYANYPLLTRLFEELEVPVKKSDMSFGTSISNGWLEYSSKAMFAQRRNILRPAFWGLVRDILRFNQRALKYLERNHDVSLKQCLDELGMGDWFRHYYLQAMGAAIWSCSVDTILEFPAKTFVQFFKNHNLLGVTGHHQWYTVDGGSREYVKRLTASFKDQIRLSRGVVRVEREDDCVDVYDNQGGYERFDAIVFACHADQAMRMLAEPTLQEEQIIGAFRYQENDIVVHGDTSFMPKTRGAWASWVYLSEDGKDDKPVVSLSYWMNDLQSIRQDVPVLVTLNPERQPADDLVYDRYRFEHPMFDAGAMNAQQKLESLQGQNNTWYCGAYQRYGFHEDGLLSAYRVVNRIGIREPLGLAVS